MNFPFNCQQGGPKFTKNLSDVFPLQYNVILSSSELFVNCLEAMVETCLPAEEKDNVPVPASPHLNLNSSYSSLTFGSPDKGSQA